MSTTPDVLLFAPKKHPKRSEKPQTSQVFLKKNYLHPSPKTCSLPSGLSAKNVAVVVTLAVVIALVLGGCGLHSCLQTADSSLTSQSVVVVTDAVVAVDIWDTVAAKSHYWSY